MIDAAELFPETERTSDRAREALLKPLAEQRRRARELFEAHRKRLRSLQQQLVSHLERAGQEVAGAEIRLAEQDRSLQQRHQELEIRSQQLHDLTNDALGQRQAWEQRLNDNDNRLSGLLEELRQHVDLLKDGAAPAPADARRSGSAPVNRGPAKPRLSPAVPARAVSDGPLDWESLKQQMLAELEAESGGEGGNVEYQAKFDELVCRTEEVLADRDRQIAELQELLQSQASTLGGFAVGAASLGQLLDQDAIIREQRELTMRIQEDTQRLQEEWHQKLRQAEVEISIERAKIARERMELEEKVRQLEAERATSSGEDDSPAGKGKTGSKNRWRARLGLGGEE